MSPRQSTDSPSHACISAGTCPETAGAPSGELRLCRLASPPAKRQRLAPNARQVAWRRGACPSPRTHAAACAGVSCPCSAPLLCARHWAKNTPWPRAGAWLLRPPKVGTPTSTLRTSNPRAISTGVQRYKQGNVKRSICQDPSRS